MELKFKIFCTCHSEYIVNEELSTDKIVCPNCGREYTHSAKLISILNTAKDIPDGKLFNKEIKIRVIPTDEDVKKLQ